MKLTDAYEKLHWEAPVAFERAALGRGYDPSPSLPRGIGTSAHMLIELYLDMHESRTSRFGRAEFVVECLSQDQGKYLRGWLETIHAHLDLDVDLEQVRFWPTHHHSTPLRGTIWFSWAVFCDHAVKEEGRFDGDRNLGPYGLVRRLEPSWELSFREGPVWRSYDRDGRFMGVLTEDGKRELVDMATCPITLGGPAPTTYPASRLSQDVPIRLRRAFKR